MSQIVDKTDFSEEFSENLTRKTTQGIFWSGVGQFITQGIGFGVNIILARLLFPEDFGILAMAAMLLELATLVSDIGLNAAIIQRDKISQAQLASAFWANVLVGVILAGITALCAPLVADFFRRDIVAPVIMVSSIGFVLRATGSIPRALLTREMQFKILAIPDIVGIVIFALCVIPMVLMGMGLWSIVLANLVSILISTAIIWRLNPWRPSWVFDWPACRGLMSFGLNVLGSQVIDYINYNVDYMIIARLLGDAALGVYTLAFNLMTAPLRKIAQMVTRVTFPAFSRAQANDAALRGGYLKSVRYIALITFPILTGLGILADDFIRLVYSEKWAGAIIPLQIMCVDGMIRTISTTVGSILNAKNRADIGFKWKLVAVSVITPSVFIGAQYGVIGVSVAVASATFALAPIIQYITHRLIGLPFRPFGMALLPATTGSALMACGLAVLLWWRGQYWPEAEYTFLALAVLIGGGIYTVSFRLLFRDVFREALALVKQIKAR